MDFVDTHCHIQSAHHGVGERTTRELWAKAPDLTPEAMLASADEAGVKRRICVGCDLIDSELAADFAAKRAGCWASIGIHPHEAQHYHDQPHLLQQFADLAKRPKVVAVGECGLDYYYKHSPKDAQLKLLRFQLELAVKHDLPLIFHVREAFDDFWPLFDEIQAASKKPLRGVVHSFTDLQSNLEQAIQRGLLIGVNGIVTFLKAADQLDVFRAIPLESLVLETDAPFLTPTPYRGTINQPKQVRRIAEYMSELQGVSLEQLAATTTANACSLFGLEHTD